MQDWVNSILTSGDYSLPTFLAAFLLGVIGTITSCCLVPVFISIAGYSGSSSGGSLISKKTTILKSIVFLFGIIVALSVVGAVTGLLGSMLGSALGNYWKIFAGLLLIFFGLLSMGILPFSMPAFQTKSDYKNKGLLGAFIFGLIIGGLSTGCNTVCSPVFPLILSAAFLKGNLFFGILLLIVFGFGYGLPLALAMLGFSLSMEKLYGKLTKVSKYINIGAGALLLALGFYFLLTY